MYERMLDKSTKPNETAIKEYLGQESSKLLADFESCLRANYQLAKELKFPFGNGYGWGFKYSLRTAHLCYALFEKGAFTVTLQISDKQVAALEEILPVLLPKTQDLWKNRYPCGERGGWVHYRVLTDDELTDICKLIFIKKPA